MSLKHIIKNTETEIVFKCYITATGGGSIDISIQNDCTKSSQVYVTPTSIPVETGGAVLLNILVQEFISLVFGGDVNQVSS
jgi:hypothetical protein